VANFARLKIGKRKGWIISMNMILMTLVLKYFNKWQWCVQWPILIPAFQEIRFQRFKITNFLIRPKKRKKLDS